MKAATVAAALFSTVAVAAVELRSSNFEVRSSARPFADYEHTAAVVMSAADSYDTAELKRTIARHLPADVTLILYGHDKNPKTERRVLDDYGRFLPPGRLRYVTFRRAYKMLWPRDAMPMPLVSADGSMALAGPRYHGGFEPDQDVARLFSVPLAEHTYFLDGGNLIANRLGDCFVVDSKETKKITDERFTADLGCRTVGRLPKHGGIGHVDERAQFLDDTRIVTDNEDYASVFAARGFRTLMMPRPRGSHETYVNTLLVNGVAFVPQFGHATDAAALGVYRAAGFEPIGLPARTVARRGRGLIHCLTKNYPGLLP